MRTSTVRLALFFLTLALPPQFLEAQQVPDTSYHPQILFPAFAYGTGPVVLMDEGHFNFHTAEGRYEPFANLLQRDGFTVKSSSGPFRREALAKARLLVIANALNERNRTDWSLPTPSAFTDEEIKVVRDWVHEGGSLLLIADHMPFPGAVEKLASVFGIRFSNGFAFKAGQQSGIEIFRSATGSLAQHPIVEGRIPSERVDSVATFTGSAFRGDSHLEPLLAFDSSFVSAMPEVAWEFTDDTERIPLDGWYQGGVLHFGGGRVAVFGEAAMFSAQLAGPNRTPMGMNSPVAGQNPQFLLNVIHWLSGLIGEK